ncbi:hypothetical protein G5C51_11475 [Streptomyces sp. A7024]|uniref:Integral membrane protein n=1 Tax=Streptomyces coryli TaxID=1128680 RepID=A0A6G4TYC0_9ACTN|nr:hypothetical protein [Streptomyces coryli]NGN64520.1 hypothetical protein [Streptomyces coryli]
MSLTANATRTATTPTTWLRRVLLLDAAVTTANGLAYLAASGPLEDLLGVSAGLLLGLGAFLVGYGAVVGYVGLRPSPPPGAVAVFIDINLAWTAASIVAVVLLDPSGTGTVWIPLQAAVTAAFAVAQWVLLRRGR